jgi:hypothetical protein
LFWVNVRPNQTRVREQPDTGYRKYRLSYFAASPGCGGGAGAWGREIGGRCFRTFCEEILSFLENL